VTSSDQPAGPEERFDTADTAILSGMRRCWDARDPMPAWLIDRIEFAIDLNAVDFEVSRLAEIPDFAAARTDEHTRMITFQSDSLSIMITVAPDENGNLRIDGWLTPAGSHQVELRTSEKATTAVSDRNGRFSFAAASSGSAQFIIALTGLGRRVVTPSISL
jgi:hypothetical protein